MTQNVGGVDRWLRILAGVALLALGLAGVIGWWGLLGIVPLGTALVGWCPVYPLLGLNTCPVARRAG